MTSVGTSKELIVDKVRRTQELYDRHKYQDAYALSAEYWQPTTDTNALSIEALVLAGRLAVRLGGWRLSRWLLRKAIEREPSNPRVLYFTRHLRAPRMRLLDELKAFNANPDLGGDDPELRASSYASFAFTWATLRDFDRAHQCLAEAHVLSPNDGWVLSCESDVYGLADRWTEALQSAERAWEFDPGAYFAADSLASSLLHLGRVEEAANRLYSAAENCQSYQLVLDTCWYQCAFAETLSGDQKRAVLDRARALAENIPNLTPLLDREAKTAVARVNLDIAEMSHDYEAMERWASVVRSPFHRQLLANLKKNTSGERKRLPYRRTIQKHEECVPTSVTTAMSATGMELSTDELASQVTFGGTHEWAAADWLRERGYHVRFFPVTPAIAVRLLQEGIGFVLSWDAEENGHAVAVVGFDERAETLLVHDPQSFRSTEYLLTILGAGENPLGIKGMAIVTKERASLLDSILPPESALVQAAEEHQKALMLSGPSVARLICEKICTQFPDHPGARFLKGVQALEDGEVGEALKILGELLKEFPKAPHVRVRYMFACRALGNTALVRQALKNIVEGGTLPGLDAQQDWIRPPARYVFEYADLIRLSSENRRYAESLLHSVIRRQCTSAGAWHTLADLYWQERQMDDALFCYRIASCLNRSYEHYARAYADALAGQKRHEEAFQWLELRARQLGNTDHGVSTWVSWISELESLGYPERAIATCNQALAAHPRSTELLSFAVPFFARMGDWESADRWRLRLKDNGRPAAYFEASTYLCRMRADLPNAIDAAEAWIRELPRDMDARYALLDLVATRDGAEAAVDLSARWLRENKNNEDFEQAYCAQLDRAFSPKYKKYSVILRRLKRNRDDAWAWRELVFDCLSEYDLAGDRRRQRMEPTIEKFLAECDRTSSEEVATIRAHALWLENRSQWTESIEKSMRAVAIEPESYYSYKRIWECSARLDSEARSRLWARLEPLLLNSPGRITIARDIIALLAERFGLSSAEAAIHRWRAERPDDPDVMEAAADLLVEHGHGRSDAERAIALLCDAVARYPYHPGLRFSLANAYRRAGRDADAQAVLVELTRRHPDNSGATIQLAWSRQRQGDEQGAYQILDAALQSYPQNVGLLDARIQILIENANYAEAIGFIERGLERMPTNVHWRSRAITLFSQCGAEDKSVQTAKRGVELEPRGAYLWMLLARTLNDFRQFAEVGEVEACLRRSLELNNGLFDSADLLAFVLSDQNRHKEALSVLRLIEPRLVDPSPALGRMAWIRRAQGEKSEAVDDMCKTLAAAPWYDWGWTVLIDWLEKDEAWEKARNLLQEIPAPMFTNTNFRLRRLLLLEKAGLEAAKLDSEWDSLLKDFPEDVSLHARRYDSLRDAKRPGDAASVLNAILATDPDNPFLLARQVEVLARDYNKQPAIDVALRICFAPVEESTWLSDKVWNVARDAMFSDELLQKCRERLVAGQRPTLQSFSWMADHAIAGETKRIKQPLYSSWFPPKGAREITRLLDLLSKVTWETTAYRAVLYRVLSDYGFDRLVARIASKRRDPSTMGVDEWSQLGRVLTGGKFYSAGRRLLRDWREMPGVEMWVVANYTLCLSVFRREQLRARLATCRDALTGLPHDHCAKYLAHLQAESSALLGDRRAVVDCWNQYPNYFDGKIGDGEYFKTEDRHLLKNIPELAENLQAHRHWRSRRLIWKLWLKRIFRTAPRTAGTPDDIDVPWWVFWIALMLALQLIRRM